MEKIKISERRKYPNRTIFFSFGKLQNLHILLCNFMADLGIQDGDDLDIIFDKVEDKQFYVYGGNYTAHIFVMKNCVSVSIESTDNLSKNQLIKTIRKYFEY